MTYVWNENCTAYKGAWWYDQCYGGNLNGQYLSGMYTTVAMLME